MANDYALASTLLGLIERVDAGHPLRLRFYQVFTDRDRRAATIAAQLGELTGE